MCGLLRLNMESLHSLFAITLLFISFHQVLCESQEIYFEIKDGNLNEVIFIGEKDIILICHVSNILHADVTITKVGEGSVANNDGIGNCLEYNIQQVTAQTGGNYSCTSRYDDKNTGSMVEMSRTLLLNVRDNQSASCLRNGTGLHQAYSAGDVLSLSCYCDVSIKCNWIKTVQGSQVGENVPSMEVQQHNGKVIRRIVVGPLTSMDLATRYDCSFGSRIDQRCSIGPANVFINDYISLSSQQSDLSEGCPTPITSETKPGEITSTSDTNVVTSSTMDSKDTTEETMRDQEIEEEPVDFLIYIIVGVCTVVVLFIVLLCLLIAIVKTKKGTNKQDQQVDEKPEEDSTDPQQEDYTSNTPTYASPVKREVSADVIQYAASTATVKINDEDDEVDEFCTVDVTEYNIPVAFRRDDFGEDFQQREENRQAVPNIITG